MLWTFFLNDTATPEIYTLSLHDALPIYLGVADAAGLDLLGDHLGPGLGEVRSPGGLGRLGAGQHRRGQREDGPSAGPAAGPRHRRLMARSDGIASVSLGEVDVPRGRLPAAHARPRVRLVQGHGPHGGPGLLLDLRLAGAVPAPAHEQEPPLLGHDLLELLVGSH